MLNTFENAERQHFRRKERQRHLQRIDHIFSHPYNESNDSVEEINLAPAAQSGDSLMRSPPPDSRKSYFLSKRVGWICLVLPGVLLAVVLAFVFHSSSQNSKVLTENDNPGKESEVGNSELYHRLYNLILDWRLTSEKDLSNPRSASARALKWLVQDTMSVHFSVEAVRVRFALASLYYSTHGESPWTRETHWLSSFPVCLWFGVECYNRDDTLVIVKSINLSSNALFGILPAELSLLGRDCQSLDVSDNSIGGSFPDLSAMKNLQKLYIGPNNFSSSLPDYFYELTHLTHLYAENCGFSGRLSTKLGQLTNLQGLAIEGNFLTGTIPSEIGLLTDLRVLYLDENVLSSSIPSTLGMVSNLMDVRLSRNRLRGTIPTELAALKTLQILYLNNNELTGQIPRNIHELLLLRELHLYQNHLSGSIPSELGSLVLLDVLYLDDNRLHGSIPATLGKLRFLEYLYIFDNYLTGEIPAEILELESLTAFRAHDNALSGRLRSDIGQLKKLEVLTINNNLFSGTFPSELSQLSHLKVAQFHANLFTGAMPSAVCSGVKHMAELTVLTADCLRLDVTCRCCTQCYGNNHTHGSV